MNNAGFIYILINPSMDGLVKIGKTKKDPIKRVNELSSATGVPTSFTLVYKEYFDDCDKAEKAIHLLLEERGYRLTNNREFFNIPVYDAIKIIQEYKEEKIGSKFTMTSVKENKINPLAFIYFEQAKDYYLGTDITLQDYNDAYSLFKKSSDLGSLRALEFLGKMKASGEGCKEDFQQALEFLKQGSKFGNRFCYAEMAHIYTQLNHAENAEKCYTFYFNMIDYNLINKDDIFYLTSYVDNQFETINNQYIPLIILFKNEIIQKLNLYTKMAIDSRSGDEDYANYVKTFRGKRISWLESLEEPEWEPTIYDAYEVRKLDCGIVIFVFLVKGKSNSLGIGDRILLQSPSVTLEAKILMLHRNQTSLSILLSERPEDYDKYLFIKEGAVLKPIR